MNFSVLKEKVLSLRHPYYFFFFCAAFMVIFIMAIIETAMIVSLKKEIIVATAKTEEKIAEQFRNLETRSAERASQESEEEKKEEEIRYWAKEEGREEVGRELGNLLKSLLPDDWRIFSDYDLVSQKLYSPPWKVRSSSIEVAGVGIFEYEENMWGEGVVSFHYSNFLKYTNIYLMKTSKIFSSGKLIARKALADLEGELVAFKINLVREGNGEGERFECRELQLKKL